MLLPDWLHTFITASRLTDAPRGYTVQFIIALAFAALSITGTVILAAIGRPIPTELSMTTIAAVTYVFGNASGFAAGRVASDTARRHNGEPRE
jgi:hypothetical protein